MKRITTLFVFLLVCGIGINAQQRNENEAMNIAKEFLIQRGGNPKLSVASQQKVKSEIRKKVPAKNLDATTKSGYYIVNDEANNRFVIVSSDERLYTILGYSDNGTFDAENAPEGLLEMLDGYDQTYNYIMTSDKKSQVRKKSSYKAIEPLIKTQWHQIYPYNADCPVDPRLEDYADMEDIARSLGIDIRCATGCVATAMAQIMNYHQYPDCGHGSISYKTRTLNISQSMDFSSSPFDWNNMANTYIDGNYSETQKKAIANLMHVCGNSVIMDYTQGGSGAQNPNLAYALIHYFGYNPNIRHYEKKYFKSEEWEQHIHTDLENNRPIIYTGQGLETLDDGTTKPYGHAFVLDGCNSEGLYHINWGYNGKYDGYFELTALNIDDSNYNLDQAMICNISTTENGNKEDLFFAEEYIQSDWLENNKVGGFASGTLSNIYCYSVDANTYSAEFNGEIGIGLFDANLNFIKSLDKYDTNIKAYYGWGKRTFSYIYDNSTFSEGSKYNIAPYAKAKNSSKPTLIRTTNGVSDAYNVEVKDGKIIVNLGWIETSIPSTNKIVNGNYAISAFNFSNTREDWNVTVSQTENKDTVWFSNFDKIGAPGAVAYGIVTNQGTQIKIPTDQVLNGNKYLYNYSSAGDITVYVSSKDSTMTIQDVWGTIEKSSESDSDGTHSVQKELSKYSSTILQYKPLSDIVEAPVIIVNNKKLSITCSTEGAEIYYTIGGASPDKNSLKYTGTVSLTDNRPIKAIAYKGNTSSSVTEKNDINEFKVSTPKIVVNGTNIEITVAAPTDATIYYTIDGSNPQKTEDNKYSGPISINNKESIIKALGSKSNWYDSDISEYVYTPESDPAPTNYEISIKDMKAGQLSTHIPSDNSLLIKSLWISGEINGTDIKLIREMTTSGNLSNLNIQNVRIVSGGDYYYSISTSNYSTTEDVIGAFMFYGCKKLITLTLPEKTSCIESFAFDGCESLKYLNIPSGCEEIKTNAIYNCKNLEKVYLPSNIAKINETNFLLCPKLQSIEVEENNTSFKSVDGILYSKNGLSIIRYPENKEGTIYAIPSGVTTIGAYAFRGTKLSSISIPTSVTNVKSNAFASCINIKQIEIPNSVTEIGMMAFMDCSNLSNVKMSDNVA